MKVLLYSGGFDSWIISCLWRPDLRVYFDIGTEYSEFEKKGLDADVLVVPLPGLSQYERRDGIIPTRNLIFCSLASIYGDEICLGATYGDRVLDKSIEFAEMASGILSHLWKKQWWTERRDIRVVLPYKGHTKIDLLDEYLRNGGNVHVAWKSSRSCYHPDGNGNPCWKCKPCLRKWAAFARFGYAPIPRPLGIESLLTEERGRETEQYRSFLCT